MANYVERSSLFRALRDIDWYERADATLAIETTNKLPFVVDAAPVRHGQWAIKTHGRKKCLHCSECDFQNGVGVGFNYCPGCGAKMEGEWL